MARFLLVAVSSIALFAGGAVTLVAWLTGDEGGVARAVPTPELPRDARVEPAPVTLPAVVLPEHPAARERAVEANEVRQLFETMRRGFAAAPERSVASEARVLPALDAAFPQRTPRWALECRRLVCRLDVEAPASTWREAFSRQFAARQNVDRAAWAPDGSGLVFLELLEARRAEGPARAEGEELLDDLEKGLLASETVRACVKEGPAPGGAEVRLVVDRSGVTYRFGAQVDPGVASCLMMQGMPDVMASVSAPAGVRNAERKVVIPAVR